MPESLSIWPKYWNQWPLVEVHEGHQTVLSRGKDHNISEPLGWKIFDLHVHQPHSWPESCYCPCQISVLIDSQHRFHSNQLPVISYVEVNVEFLLRDFFALLLLELNMLLEFLPIRRDSF